MSIAVTLTTGKGAPEESFDSSCDEPEFATALDSSPKCCSSWMSSSSFMSAL
eukprot:CAMPEP_0197562962 /NCGR_PEP_ID=MMETSP1320-20131121/27871_1 /TAXON_ID=91990 /ORGANISM="Bolidomonas sp., Strain RCC2347" /LENGTH=51 /DNA_ID=CAMNT_0043124731 /DNA_START=126 /DNA_END=278 /DNA_ORIENTATION=-